GRREPIGQSVLGEEGDVMDDDGPGRHGGGKLSRPGPNERMHDRIQLVEGSTVGKHDSRQRGAIQFTVPTDDVRSESGDDGGKAGRARPDDLSSDDIAIDDDRTMLAQQGRYRALSRSETAGQPHVHFSEAPCGSDSQRPANFSRNAASASSVARVPLFSAASDE